MVNRSLFLFLVIVFYSCNRVTYIYHSNLPRDRYNGKIVRTEIKVLEKRGKIQRIVKIDKSNRRLFSSLEPLFPCDSFNYDSTCLRFLEDGKVVEWRGAFYLRSDLPLEDFRKYINQDIEF